MDRISVGVALVLMVLTGNAIPDGYSRGNVAARHGGAGQVLLADSGGNPWALPDPRRQGGRLPEYITNPKYATKEDIETKLDHGSKNAHNGAGRGQQVVPQQGYGAPLGLPAVPQIYAPYGYQPGVPMYPGYGGVPGLGVPYMGDTGFGGNPLLTPYGNIYGNPVPYQGQDPSSGSK